MNTPAPLRLIRQRMVATLKPLGLRGHEYMVAGQITPPAVGVRFDRRAYRAQEPQDTWSVFVFTSSAMDRGGQEQLDSFISREDAPGEYSDQVRDLLLANPGLCDLDAEGDPIDDTEIIDDLDVSEVTDVGPQVLSTNHVLYGGRWEVRVLW